MVSGLGLCIAKCTVRHRHHIIEPLKFVSDHGSLDTVGQLGSCEVCPLCQGIGGHLTTCPAFTRPTMAVNLELRSQARKVLWQFGA